MSRILFHVHHLLGTGHLFRAARLAKALAEAGHEVHLASGGLPLARIDTGGAELHQLPPARAEDDRFQTLVDAEGRPVDETWRDRRRQRLLDLFEALKPDMLVVETFPFGRGLIRFELEPLMAAARAAAWRPLVIASIRDIVARKSPARERRIVTEARQWIDRILVHGDPTLIPLDETFAAAAELSEKIYYTGYVAEPAETIDPEGPGCGEVVVSAGGGAVGQALLEVALAARPLSRHAEAPWRLLVGGHGADTLGRLREQAPDGVTVEPTRPDFRAVLARAAASISQAGYNTVMDLLTLRVPAVVVPFQGRGEIEQRLRADRLADRGWLTVLPESDLTAGALAAALDHAARPPWAGFDTGGVDRSVALIGDWLLER